MRLRFDWLKKDTERLLAVENYGRTRMNDLKNKYMKYADYSVLIVNSNVYGGSGGEFCVASLNTSSLEMMLHELGHTVADLGDEYWTAPGGESANMTMVETAGIVQARIVRCVSWEVSMLSVKCVKKRLEKHFVTTQM